jgi:hypothetical protein
MIGIAGSSPAMTVRIKFLARSAEEKWEDTP